MATRTIEMLIDDLDGETATQTVPFALDGVSYEIDLTDEHAEELRAALAKFVDAARRVGGRRKYGQARTDAAALNGSTRKTVTATADGKAERKAGKAKGKASAKRVRMDAERGRAIRAWAEENGYDVSSRGRIPASVQEAYDTRDSAAS